MRSSQEAGKIINRDKRQFSRMRGNGCHRMVFKSNAKLEHLSTGSV